MQALQQSDGRSEKQEWKEFERNCAAKNIQIIIADRPEALEELTH